MTGASPTGPIVYWAEKRKYIRTRLQAPDEDHRPLSCGTFKLQAQGGTCLPWHNRESEYNNQMV